MNANRISEFIGKRTEARAQHEANLRSQRGLRQQKRGRGIGEGEGVGHLSSAGGPRQLLTNFRRLLPELVRSSLFREMDIVACAPAKNLASLPSVILCALCGENR